MDFINEQEVNAILNYLKRDLGGLYSKLKSLGDNVADKYISISNNIKIDLLAALKKISYQEFQKKFYEEYGDNYDVNSLNKCLSFYIDDDFSPIIKYDKSNFVIKANFSKDARAFNQNARVDGGYKDLIELDEMDILEDYDFYDLSSDDIDPFDYAIEEISPPDDYEVFKPRRLIKDTAQVFKEAQASAYAAYQEELNNNLIYKIINKYHL